MNTVTLDQVVVYKVLSGDFRAYVKSNPALQAWGFTKDRAIARLAQVLAEKNIPFNFSRD